MGRKKKKADKAKPKSLLGQLAANPEALRKPFREQVGALCYRCQDNGAALEILLVTSRETGRWVIPKGWPMKGKTWGEAATIEAWEEAGVRGQLLRSPVGRYTYLKSLDDGDVVPCIVEVFAIEVSAMSSKFREHRERKIAWTSPDEAARRVREIELKALLIEFRPR